ncbi:MAG TPA: sugar transferase [Bacteroidales bacterium]|nr:sugar transferase [Bacteroidales bacterium]HPS62394.1 sugar transferase [Bacteroidales bacterium]
MKDIIHILYVGRSTENISRLTADPQVGVSLADNILHAQETLRATSSIDAILCERQIPGGDAFLLHERLRSLPRYDAVPFILISEIFEADLIRRARQEGIDDFFVMPLPPADELKRRICFLKRFRNQKRTPEEEKTETQTFKMPVSKRIFDIVVAGSALLLLSPVLLLVGLAIRLESKGRIYYVSKRVGRKPFDFYKLRSMRSGSDAELARLAKEKNQYKSASEQEDIDFDRPCPRCSQLSEGQTCSPVLYFANRQICDYWYTVQKQEMTLSKPAFVKIADDPRITRVGKLIRNTSIDELPQLFNVLKGEMSIVGNRPLPVYEAERLTRDAASKRFLAPAGITGLWQVELRGKGGSMSEEERMRLDNLYADHFVGDNYSFWYDMKLILRTIPALFQKAAV